MSTPNLTTIIKSIAPVSFLILCFEGAMKLKFSCPCSVWLNQTVALFFIVVPTAFSYFMMSLFLKFQEHNSGESAQNGMKEKYGSMKLIPPVLWICILLIDGDYVACGFTFNNTQNFCDSNQRLNCLSWCNPVGQNHTLIHPTYLVNTISKVNTKYFYPTLQMSSFVRYETVVIQQATEKHFNWNNKKSVTQEQNDWNWNSTICTCLCK